MKKSLILLGLLLIQAVAFAQTGFIKGQFVDSLDYSDARGKLVRNGGLVIYFQLDAKGTFLVDSLAPGQWDLTIEKPGFESFQQTGIVVKEEKYTLLLDLRFTPIGQQKKKKNQKR